MTLRDVRYAHTDGIDLAYTVNGDGPIDVVLVTGLLGHLEYNEEMPYYRAIVNGIPRFARLIVLDRRGVGLSGGAPLPPIEDQMGDIRSVMDAAGSERATLIGCVDGGPLAILFAASTPERVERLVLWETWARRLVADDYPVGSTREEVANAVAWTREQWGTGLWTRAITVDAKDEVSAVAAFARWERNIATPSEAAECVARNCEVDVRDVLPLIDAPTLVLHARSDPLFPAAFAEALVDRLPNATMRWTEGCGNHMSMDPAWGEEIVDEIVGFLTGSTAAVRSSSRVLATVLFTDIVGSTERASALGDAAWKELLVAHDRLAAHVVHARGGRVVKSTGDGLLATFDGPGRGVEAALVLVRDAAALGLTLRAGLHTGEIVLVGDDVGGVAVHIASRIEAAAAPGTVMVSSTVVDLVVGSGHEFEVVGRRSFAGIDREWDIFTATA